MWLLLAAAWAAPLPIQGALTDATGAPLNGTYNLTFRLYNASGDAVSAADWSEVDAVALVGGSFQTWLGDQQAVPDALLQGDLWVGVTVADGPESERAPIGWAPRASFAARAASAATADDATRVGGQTLGDLDGRFARLSGAPQTGSLNLSGSITAADLILGGTSLASTLGAYLPLTGGALSGALTLPGDPTAGTHAATKAYVDAADALRLPLTGGALSGALTLPGAPTNSAHAATKAYVDAADALRLPLTGGALSGALTLPGDPTAGTHAATKAYVDNAVSNGVGSASQYLLKNPSGTGDAELTAGIRLANSAVTCAAGNTATHGTLSFANGLLRVCTSAGWRNIRLANDGSSPGSAGRTCLAILQDYPASPSGRYWVDPDGDGNTADAWQAWCDMTRNGGGWTLIQQNNAAVAAARINYAASTTTSVNIRGGTFGDNLGSFDLIVGLAEYPQIGTTARYEVGSTAGTPTKAATFTMTVNPADGYRLAVSNGTALTGHGLPGMYSTHNGYRWSASDVDQDVYSSACEALYFQPWWYTQCWDGSLWGSSNGGHADAAFWAGASTDNWTWGALWLK